jgi:hypothetical protein
MSDARTQEDIEAATKVLMDRVKRIDAGWGDKTEYVGLTSSGVGPLLYAIVDALEAIERKRLAG